MADFSNQDIEEAKKRVRQMQSRNKRLVNNDEEYNGNKSKFNEPEMKKEKKEKAQPNDKNGDKDVDILSKLLGDGDKSQFIILVLILVLSREGADNMLILALLYLLL